jgi:hypothetical protein
MSEPWRFDPACYSTSISGNGSAASLRGAIRGSIRAGSAVDFDHARADLEKAWRRLLPTRTEEHFREWRDQRASMARMYEMRERGDLLPSQKPNTIMRWPLWQVRQPRSGR